MLPAAIVDRIRGMLRGELGVTLSESDGSRNNQDALELLQDIQLELARERPVENLEAYAVSVAEHRIADHLRAVRPRHFSIRNRLRYFLRRLSHYAEWPAPNGRMAGFAEWAEAREPADAIQVAYLVHNPWKVPAGGDSERMNRDDWDRLLRAIFVQLAGPALVNDLAAIVCAVLQVKEVRLEPLDPAAHPGVDPADPRAVAPDLESRDLLRLVWAEIRLLLPRQRIALLLNMGGDGDPALFCEAGIASLEEICRALGLTEAQYRLALGELLLRDAEPCGALLRHVPLDDLSIARLLDARRDQVIGLRRKARERLARRLRAYGNTGTDSPPWSRAT